MLLLYKWTIKMLYWRLRSPFHLINLHRQDYLAIRNNDSNAVRLYEIEYNIKPVNKHKCNDYISINSSQV